MKRPTDDLDVALELANESTSSRPTDSRPVEPMQEIGDKRMDRDELMPPNIIDEDGGSTETSSEMTAEDNINQEGLSPDLGEKAELAEKEDNKTVETATAGELINETTQAVTLAPVTLAPKSNKSESPTTVDQLLAEELTKPTLTIIEKNKDSSLRKTIPPSIGEKSPTDRAHEQHAQRDFKGSKGISKDDSKEKGVSRDGNVNCQGTGGLFSRYSCEAAVSIQDHHIVYVGMTTILVFYCLLRFFCCPSNRLKHDDKGEYRAVAEQYGNYNDDAFCDEFSAQGSYEEYDDYQDDWSAGGPNKKSIEMVNRERNGGLTLEEMNG
mmetsp:Transcript_21999/g.32494  ORF Transcript_21999/g.32494 Transcript_21999/m.32494 type:complete len:324 (+) Transcript_21999:177-1148(+)|eukprot:CAMPEP_0194223328 /NCGR_PEP_ID=MMETSP0156-20130528/34880_1 /TAXON_ID=33649 /ORGANISM="Thalassionema nitzschioides, Strain L26-B" /LENGTH=323 /DNA_ID=CAMNT_0038954423 /DNA_START=105 /DNA_END=1076 /DNA_ORIENTATION=-